MIFTSLRKKKSNDNFFIGGFKMIFFFGYNSRCLNLWAHAYYSNLLAPGISPIKSCFIFYHIIYFYLKYSTFQNIIQKLFYIWRGKPVQKERGTATVRPLKMSSDATRFVLGSLLSETSNASETLRLWLCCSPLISSIVCCYSFLLQPPNTNVFFI